MGIDIRLPIGILFSMLGLVLAAYGSFGDTSRYQQSLGVNINLGWGVVLLAFGLLMFVLGRRGMRAARRGTTPQSSDSLRHG